MASETNSKIIWEGEHFVLLSKKNESGETVIVKSVRDRNANGEYISILQNELNFSGNEFRVEGLRTALSIGKDENEILLNYIDGETLKSWLDKSRDLKARIDMAFKLSSILTRIHEKGIIYRNFSPMHVLVSKSGTPVFINLSFATRVVTKIKALPGFALVGDPHFISPEQTGRINRMVDFRSDLYGLGALLYWLFSGTPPLDGNDMLEIVHAHIAIEPLNLHANDTKIPVQLSRIISRLLAKNPDERYQSASGLKNDLQKCIATINENGEIHEFATGENDFSGTLSLTHKIYGREEEQKLLKDAFHQAVNGNKSLVIVAAFSGMGKTSLVNALYEPAYLEKCFFISGKYDFYKRDVPYSGFIGAIQNFVELIFFKDEASVLYWKKYLHDAILPLGRLIANLIPETLLLLGEQPELPELNGLEAQNRFHYAFISFIKAIAKPENPVIVFLDDLQWADSSSITLLKKLMEEQNLRHIVFIGAIRENEVEEHHPLRECFKALIKNGIAVKEMHLQKLTNAAVSDLVKDALQSQQENISELSEIVSHKSQGNALFIHQFLRSVFEDGLLLFDFQNYQWTWNKEAIIRRNLSGDIEELLSNQIEKLNEGSQVLRYASCIGPSFQFETLAAVAGLTLMEVKKIVEPALIGGMVLESGNELVFSHDRIQHLLYSKIAIEEKTKIHYKIAIQLLKGADDKFLSDNIFDLVYHWNIASKHFILPQEKKQLIQLNMKAAKRAKNSAAYSQALQYYKIAIENLPADSWNEEHEYTLEIYTDTADTAYLSGNHELSDGYLNKVFTESRDVLEKVRAVEIQMQSLVARSQPLQAIAIGKTLLNELGINFPENRGKIRLVMDLLSADFFLKRRSENSILNLKRNNDLKARAAMNIIYRFLSAGYFAMPEIIPLSILQLLRLTLKYGLDSKSPYVFIGFGYIQSAFFGKIEEGDRYADLAMNLLHKLDAQPLSAAIYGVYYPLVKHWRMPLNETIEPLRTGFRLGQENGDVEFATYLAHNIIYHSLYAGNNLSELLEYSGFLQNQVTPYNQELTLKRIQLFRQSIADLISFPEKTGILLGTYFNEIKNNPEPVKQNDIYFQNLNLQKLVLCFIYRQKQQAWQFALEAAKYEESIQGSALLPVFHFYEGLAAADMAETNPEQKHLYLKILKNNLSKFEKYRKYSDINFGQKYKILEARLTQVEGDSEKAQLVFFAALRKARQNKVLPDEALAWELAGEFYFSQGQDEVAGFYLQNAYNTYSKWGALAKAKQLTEKHQKYISTPDSKEKDNSRSDTDFDLASVAKAYNILSGEIILSGLLQKLMQVMVENAGAQRGVLLRERKGELFIQATLNKEERKAEIIDQEPFSNTNKLCRTIVNYAMNSENYVVIDDALNTRPYNTDPYVINYSVRSLLCIPIKQKGDLFGYLYLENNLVSGVFTPSRISLLNMLSTQVAISLENAELYNDLSAANTKLTQEIQDKEIAQKALEENEKRLEEYNATLEEKVEKRTEEIKEQRDLIEIEKQKSDQLLLNILPVETADELKKSGYSIPRRYENVTVLFTDFVDFSKISENVSADVLVNEIHFYYCAFDEIIARYGLEKIKTIGDSYMCAAGVPVADATHALNAVKAALEIAEFVNKTKEERKGKEQIFFDIRIGLHSGPVVAGIVGIRKFAYDIWGDTVNLASRMESNSETGKVNITEQTYNLIKDYYPCSFRGIMSVKNKGDIKMYFVN